MTFGNLGLRRSAWPIDIRVDRFPLIAHHSETENPHGDHEANPKKLFHDLECVLKFGAGLLRAPPASGKAWRQANLYPAPRGPPAATQSVVNLGLPNTTPPETRCRRNPLGVGSFGRIQRWLSDQSPLRGFSRFAALNLAKITFRRPTPNFKTHSWGKHHSIGTSWQPFCC